MGKLPTRHDNSPTGTHPANGANPWPDGFPGDGVVDSDGAAAAGGQGLAVRCEGQEVADGRVRQHDATVGDEMGQNKQITVRRQCDHEGAWLPGPRPLPLCRGTGTQPLSSSEISLVSKFTIKVFPASPLYKSRSGARPAGGEETKMDPAMIVITAVLFISAKVFVLWGLWLRLRWQARRERYRHDCLAGIAEKVKQGSRMEVDDQDQDGHRLRVTISRGVAQREDAAA